MTMLHELERPREYAGVVGQDKAVATFTRLEANGLGGTILLLTGGTGTGKTTLARIAASHWASQFGTIEIDATGLKAADIEELARKTSTRQFFGGWCVIINEIQGLTKAALTKLLTALESAPPCTCWFFTTTAENLELLYERLADFRPFVGRCVHIPLSQRGLCEPFARMVKGIAEKHHLDGQPLDRYVRLIKDCHNSAREAISRVQSGAMLP